MLDFAFVLIAITAKIAVCFWCYRGIVRIKRESACKHNFQRASTDIDVTFGTTSKHVCLNCGKVVTV